MSLSSSTLSFSVSFEAVVIASSISFWDATDGVSLSSGFSSSLIKFVIVSGKGVVRFRKYGEDKVIEYYASGDKIEVMMTRLATHVGMDNVIIVDAPKKRRKRRK